MAIPRLLWRVVEQATLDSLFGRSPGQYHIALGRPPGIEDFFGGLRQLPKTLQGYTVDVPVETAPGPPIVPATRLTVFFNGWLAQRREWRIASQRPSTAYRLWQPGLGPQVATAPGTDVLVLLRDFHDRFHARWLTVAMRQRLPAAMQASMAEQEIGTRVLDSAELLAVQEIAGIPGAPPSGPASAPPGPPTPPSVGDPYQFVPVPAPNPNEPAPVAVDPDVIDRGLRAHTSTQNALADHLQRANLLPVQPNASTPPFDVAWFQDGVLLLAEVKSVTFANEERQLRLGLGQVLRYTYALRAAGVNPVEPILVTEREPGDLTWLGTCSESNVVLTWPDRFRQSLGI